MRSFAIDHNALKQIRASIFYEQVFIKSEDALDDNFEGADAFLKCHPEALAVFSTDCSTGMGFASRITPVNSYAKDPTPFKPATINR
jgi:hypothetical protein